MDLIIPSAHFLTGFQKPEQETTQVTSVKYGLYTVLFALTLQGAIAANVQPTNDLGTYPDRYTVQKGDTAFSISKRFAIPLERLSELNNLQNHTIHLGQVLVFSAKNVRSESVKAVMAKAEVVKNEVAKNEVAKNEVAKNEAAITINTTIMRATTTSSAPTSRTIRIKTAALPPTSSVDKQDKQDKPDATMPKIVAPESKMITKELVVKEATTKDLAKDTLKTVEIAASSSAILNTNKTFNTIGGSYTVQKGDTAFSIARHFKLTVDLLVSLNGLASSQLELGQQLLVVALKPVKESVKESAKESAKESTKAITARVKISSVAVAVSFVVPSPLTATPNTSSNTSSDTILNTSVMNTPNNNYHVQKGDTLFSVSRQFGVTVSALQEANNLTSDALAMDTDLTIPAKLEPEPSVPNTPSEPDLGVSNGNNPSNPIDSSVWKTKAMSLMGVPYVWGGKSVRGTDCSGFTTQVMATMGIKLPRRSSDQYNTGDSVSRENLQEGDLVFFNTAGNGVSHVGIYLSEGKFINANSYVEKVAVDDLNSSYWAARYMGARRVLNVTNITASR